MAGRIARAVGIGAIVVGGLAMTACSSARAVDLNAVGAEKVLGMGTMYRTCLPEGTLVYFTQIPGSGNDSVEYEAFYAAACYREPSGKIIVTFDKPVAPTGQSGPIEDGDLGNTQPGTEDEK